MQAIFPDREYFVWLGRELTVKFPIGKCWLLISVQYSIFITRLEPRKLKQLIRDLKKLIDAKEDDVRLYELPDHFEVELLGRQQLPEGITLQLGGLEKMLQQS